MALRFNLKITNVHRGIILGTGPLVDPGYEGKLLIPLHNLTTNDYKFKGGEGLIWMEFTKLSPHSRWDKNLSNNNIRGENYCRLSEYREFPPSKKNLKLKYFIFRAVGLRSIKSSISDAVKAAQRSAEEAARKANFISYGAIGTFVLGGLALVFSLYPIGKLFLDTYEYVRDARMELNTLKTERDTLKREIKALQRKGNSSNSSQAELSKKGSTKNASDN